MTSQWDRRDAKENERSSERRRKREAERREWERETTGEFALSPEIYQSEYIWISLTGLRLAARTSLGQVRFPWQRRDVRIYACSHIRAHVHLYALYSRPSACWIRWKGKQDAYASFSALSNDGLTINKSSCESRLFPSYFFPLRRANEHPTYIPFDSSRFYSSLRDMKDANANCANWRNASSSFLLERTLQMSNYFASFIWKFILLNNDMFKLFIISKISIIYNHYYLY